MMKNFSIERKDVHIERSPIKDELALRVGSEWVSLTPDELEALCVRGLNASYDFREERVTKLMTGVG